MSGKQSKGTLKKWFDDKGYGFISLDNDSNDIFLHISALDNNLSRRPKVGDTVYFHIAKGKKGKNIAIEAVIEGVEIEFQQNYSKHYNSPLPSPKKRKSRWRMLSFSVVLFIAIGSILLERTGLIDSLRMGAQSPEYVNKSQVTKTLRKRYSCRGKTRCTQMRSCEEAMFYIQNCPGTKMDGDRDGIPCEDQWCH